MKNVDALVAAASSNAGVKAKEGWRRAFGMGVAGGAFVALAGAGVLTFGAKAGGTLSPALDGLLSSLVFCTGLALVLCAGGELFTGNCLMPLGCMRGEARWVDMIKNWLAVYAGNAVGSFIVLALVVGAGFMTGPEGLSAYGQKAVVVASGKVNLGFGAAFCRGVLCNWLVAVAVWVGFAGETVTDKVVGLVFPISLFVLSGYEHCVANLFFLPAGYVAAALTGTSMPLDWVAGMTANLVPVTLGNIVGGAFCVALLYGWTVGGLRENKQVK